MRRLHRSLPEAAVPRSRASSTPNRSTWPASARSSRASSGPSPAPTRCGGWDKAAREISIDFVYHGDEGVAGPWAANVQPGDARPLRRPRRRLRPGPDADWHLLAGDESALPAISVAVERLAPGARAHVFLEVEGPEEEQQFKSAADLTVTWLHRGDARVGERLVEAVRAFEFPEGDVHAFVHGEAGFVRDLRRLLRFEHEVPRERLSISGYWRLGHDEDGWQSSKAEWRKVDDEDEAKAAGN